MKFFLRTIGVRLVPAVLGLCAAAACVRMEDPGQFVCKSDSDCDSDEECRTDLSTLTRYCRPEGTCVVEGECDYGESCVAGRCIFQECTNDGQCAPYTCNQTTYSCEIGCSADDDCSLGFECKAGACVKIPKLALGEICSSDSVCASGICCAITSPSMCAETCTTNGDACDSDSDCHEQYCCPTPTTEGKVCQWSQCMSGAVGDDCASDEYCASGWCSEGTCRTTSKLNGDLCGDDRECSTGECCATGGGVNECGTECPLLTGDSCEIDDYSPSGCPGGGYCDGPAGYQTTIVDGFCTMDCGGLASDCGVNSNGIANVCIEQFDAYPEFACKPGCANDSDCTAIHPDLSCFALGQIKACDFDDSGWY